VPKPPDSTDDKLDTWLFGEAHPFRSLLRDLAERDGGRRRRPRLAAPAPRDVLRQLAQLEEQVDDGIPEVGLFHRRVSDVRRGIDARLIDISLIEGWEIPVDQHGSHPLVVPVV